MSISEPGDLELLRSDDPADFGRFYRRHVDAIVVFLARRTRGAETVFDLAAETFARALEHRERYDPGRGPAVAWLLGIARNLLIDAAKRGRIADESRRRLGLEPIALDDQQLARIEERGRIDLRSALADLPDDQREAVIRRVVLEQPYPQLAEHFDCSEQVARKRVSRGLANLRRTLKEQP